MTSVKRLICSKYLKESVWVQKSRPLKNLRLEATIDKSITKYLNNRCLTGNKKPSIPND